MVTKSLMNVILSSTKTYIVRALHSVYLSVWCTVYKMGMLGRISLKILTLFNLATANLQSFVDLICNFLDHNFKIKHCTDEEKFCYSKMVPQRKTQWVLWKKCFPVPSSRFLMTSTKGPPDLTEYNYFLYKSLSVCLQTLIKEVIRTETAAKSRETLKW